MNNNSNNNYFEDDIKINKKNSKRIILSDKFLFIENDKYTLSLLLKQYELHKKYTIERKEIMNKLNIKFRMP